MRLHYPAWGKPKRTAPAEGSSEAGAEAGAADVVVVRYRGRGLRDAYQRL
jgi:hypothetical protein